MESAVHHVRVLVVEQLGNPEDAFKSEPFELRVSEVCDVVADAFELRAEGGVVHPAHEGAFCYLGGLRATGEGRL